MFWLEENSAIGHGWQPELPACEKVPGGQMRQLLALLLSEYEPAGQSVQLSAIAPEYFPVGQVKQAVACFPEK